MFCAVLVRQIFFTRASFICVIPPISGTDLCLNECIYSGVQCELSKTSRFAFFVTGVLEFAHRFGYVSRL